MKKFVHKKEEKEFNYKAGTVVFDTETKKDLTPGRYKKSYGTVTNIRWWEFGQQQIAATPSLKDKK